MSPFRAGVFIDEVKTSPFRAGAYVIAVKIPFSRVGQKMTYF